MAQDVVSTGEAFIAPAARPEQATRAAAERAERYENSAYSANTQRAYDRAWRRFVTWAGLVEPVPLPLPLDQVKGYLTHLADTKSLSTVNLAAAAIAAYHEIAGQPIALDELWRSRRGIRNTKGVAAGRKAPPLRVAQIARMIAACGPDLVGTRDKAILSLGFSAGLRRSEITALRVEDVAFTREIVSVEGVDIEREIMRITIRRSKTDQVGKGNELVIERSPGSAFCAAAAVETWLKAADITSDSLFRGVNRWGHLNHSPLSGEAIRLIVRNRAIDAGLGRDDFRAHSLRAGLATSAFDLGIALQDVSKRLRHKNPQTTQGYDRRTAVNDAEKFRILYPEFAPDEKPAKTIKADQTKPAIDDAELRELIRQADEAQRRVEERLKQFAGTAS
jgi:integrase